MIIDAPILALVLEDEVFIVLDLEEALLHQGVAVAATYSLNVKALEWLADHRPDIAIIDYRLRDGTSEQVSRALRALSVPTLIYSGNSYEPALHEADYGMFSWLNKPSSLEAVTTALQPLLQAARESRSQGTRQPPGTGGKVNLT
jgi:DNA-binding NtrC family response regulator